MKHKKDKNPIVSVLLPVYNAGKYLQESVIVFAILTNNRQY